MREAADRELDSGSSDPEAQGAAEGGRPTPGLEPEAAADAAVSDVGWALPTLGAALLVSPLIRVASGEDEIFGAPAAIVYVFAVWAGLIILAFLLARRGERAARAAEAAAAAVSASASAERGTTEAKPGTEASRRAARPPEGGAQ